MNNKELLQAAIENELIKAQLNVSFDEATDALLRALCSLAKDKYRKVLPDQGDFHEMINGICLDKLRSIRDFAELAREFKGALRNMDAYRGVIVDYYDALKQILVDERPNESSRVRANQIIVGPS